jgi:hypothetical protein
MPDMRETLKYTFTVEGETEQWYLLWLRDQINACPDRDKNISIVPKVQQSPAKFYKSTSRKVTPVVTHICDVESNEPVHVSKFQTILSEMKDAQTNKRIDYHLGYSNFSFELWMVLHKKGCNGPLSHRSQYLLPINQIFGENFEDLDHYKAHDAFHRCLAKLTLDDVKAAIRRAETITRNNERDGKTLLQHKGYKYYRDNPALSINEAVKQMLAECGVL